jgi:hypothetical protein
MDNMTNFVSTPVDFVVDVDFQAKSSGYSRSVGRPLNEIKNSAAVVHQTKRLHGLSVMINSEVQSFRQRRLIKDNELLNL